jgi:hypothetical protein
VHKDLKKFILDTLVDTVQRTVKRMSNEDTHRPFHSALLSEDLLANSRFERSFSTSFGQGAIEKISAEVIRYNGGSNVQNQFVSNIRVPNLKLEEISKIIDNLRDPKKSFAKPSWVNEITSLSNIVPQENSRYTNLRVISDLYWFKDGKHNYASIKTVKPNIDQTAQAKKDLLTLKAADPACNTFFCLYYNPYGESRSDYNHAAPANIFNFKTDECVLIGKDYWDHLGGVGFYEELLDVFEEAGEKTRPMR